MAKTIHVWLDDPLNDMAVHYSMTRDGREVGSGFGYGLAMIETFRRAVRDGYGLVFNRDPQGGDVVEPNPLLLRNFRRYLPIQL